MLTLRPANTGTQLSFFRFTHGIFFYAVHSVLYLSPFSTVPQCGLGNLVLPTDVKNEAKTTSVHATFDAHCRRAEQ